MLFYAARNRFGGLRWRIETLPSKMIHTLAASVRRICREGPAPMRPARLEALHHLQLATLLAEVAEYEDAEDAAPTGEEGAREKNSCSWAAAMARGAYGRVKSAGPHPKTGWHR